MMKFRQTIAAIIGIVGAFIASSAEAQTVCPPTAVILNSIPYGRGPGNSSYNCMVPAANSIVMTSSANVPSLVPKTSVLTAVNILNYGAMASDNTKGAINAAAFAAAFAASPSVYCPDGQTFYSQDVVIPTTGTHLFGKCTIIAAGTMSIAGIVSQNNSAGLLIEDVKVQVNTGTYPTIYGILFNSNVGVTIRNAAPGGLHAILLSNSSFISILNNPLGTFSGIGIYSNVGGADLLISGNTTSGGTNGVVLTGSARANVSNNTVSGTSSIAISAAASSSYVNVAGNQVVNVAGGAGISFNVCTHCQAENNNVTGSAAFGITASLGGDILISGNNTYATVFEGVHIDSLDSAVISSNNLVFTGTSADVGISVSNDNTTLATNVQVVGNNIVSPFGACVYFVGVQYSTVIANNCRNANVGPSSVNSSIVLDGSMTQHNTIGTNTIEDTIGNNLYQVAEGNFTAGGTPSNNIIAQQLGPAGTSGFILASTTTNRIVRATSSSNNPDTISGFYFDASPFAQRSIPSTSVVLYDYSGLAVGSLGSTGTPTIFWADTTHEWWDRGVGTKFASLDTNSWSWRAVAAAATPASGIGRVYIDSTTKALTSKDDAGTLHTTVIANTGGLNLFVTAVSAAGVITTARPTCANLSDASTGCSAAAGITALTGDVTATGPGSVAATLASVISAGGPTGSATVAPIITYDAKGRLTAVSSATITPAASSITGGAALTKTDDTNVTLTLGGAPATSLLVAASITAGWTGQLSIARGGTGQATASAAFNALSPMTTGGDIIYGGTFGVGTRLAAGTSVQVLHGGTTPSWSAVSLTADVTGTLPASNGGTGITSLGTGVAAALGVNVGSAGAFIVNGGALGTPSSGVGTNLTGTAAGLTAGAATALATARSIYGNNFDGSAALAQIIASTFGGTGNGFTKFSGPTTSEKTFTLPNSNATVLTDNAAVTVAQGGIGVGTLASNGVLYGNGTGAVQALAVNASATTAFLSQTSSAAPAWISSTGTGNVVRATSPTITSLTTVNATTFGGPVNFGTQSNPSGTPSFGWTTGDALLFVGATNGTQWNPKSNDRSIMTLADGGLLSIEVVLAGVPQNTGKLVVGAITDPGAGNFLVAGHLLASGTVPTVSSCGVSPSIAGSDNFGTVTAGTGVLSSCVINFAKTWGATPRCVASSSTAIASMTVTATTTQLTIGGTSLTGDAISWICGATARLDNANDNDQLVRKRMVG